MSQVACHQVISTGGIGAFQEFVVIGVLRNSQRGCGMDVVCVVLEELQELKTKAFTDFQFRTRKHFPVFRQNGRRDV